MKKTLYLGLAKLSLVIVFLVLALLQFKQERNISFETIAKTNLDQPQIKTGELLLDKDLEPLAVKK